MIQLQALNNILDKNNLDEYLNSGVNGKYFDDYKEEYNFIYNHYSEYDKVPDITTFINTFPDFEVIDVLEPTKYIIANLKEEFVYKKTVDLLTASAHMVEKNSYEGLNNIISKGEKLLQENTVSESHNINDMIDTRLADIKSKRELGGMLGISSGMKEIDKILGGWLPGEELVVIVGRVNQGKSWLLQKFLTEAHSQNKTILHYSGEMGVMQVAYRHDTLALHYSNRQLMRATIEDGDFTEYNKSLQDRRENLNPYYVFTPKDIGGKYLDLSTLRGLIKKYKPDIVGIDQLSLMSDERRGENKRIQLTNITAGLYSLSEEFGIPILADAQANRNKADFSSPENPDLSDIGESDGIGQNATRVISLVQTKLGLSLFIPKNRYGENNKKLIYSWDIDLGIFRFVETEEMGEKTGEEDQELAFKNKKEIKQITDVF